MRAFGASEEIIAEKLGITSDPDIQEIEVWSINFNAVNVFMRCKNPILVGMGGAVYDTVYCQEVESACRMMRVPRREQLDILDDVQLMSSASARIKNENQSSRPIPKKPGAR